MGYEVDIFKSILLAHEAQDAAVSWGIDDRSTTLRETIWLLRALEITCKNVLQVFFNVKQLDKQKKMKDHRTQLYRNMTLLFRPAVIAFNYIKGICRRKQDFNQSSKTGNWVRRRDPISRAHYYIYRDEYVLVETELTVSSQGWYEFFDGESKTPYYAYLGEFGWQHVTWKRPHKLGKSGIQHGNGRQGRGPMVVAYESPSEHSIIENMKTKLLIERLNEYDNIMEKIGNLLKDK